MPKKNLYSLEIERATLSSLIRYPEFVGDYIGAIKPNFYYHKVHSAIFSCICSLYQSKGTVDPLLVTERLLSLGVSRFEDLDTAQYIETLCEIPIQKDAAHDYFKNLIKYHIVRKTQGSLEDAQNKLVANLEKDLIDIVSIVDKALAEAGTSNISDEEDPIDIFSTLEDTIYDRVHNPRVISIQTGFKIFDWWYSGLSIGDLAVILAPTGAGKSSFVNFVAHQAASIPENNLMVLVLDTEMETDRIQFRNVSTKSGVHEYRLKTGAFSQNPQEKMAVDVAIDYYKKLAPLVHHKYVANKDIDAVMNIARRWYYKNVKDGQNCLICYDYIKLINPDIDNAWSGQKELGQTTDKLKKLVSELPRTAGLSAVQVNAQGEEAGSRQIRQYTSTAFQLWPKTWEEINQEGRKFGTHKLMEIKTRVRGEGTSGTHNLIKVEMSDGTTEWKQNFINFSFENFGFKECGTAQDLIQIVGTQLPVEKKSIKKDYFVKRNQ